MKSKRTYNISSEAIAAVKRLVEDRHAAPTQDALVEQAIMELERRIRDADDARLWEQAAGDRGFRDEARRLDDEFVADDRRAWDP